VPGVANRGTCLGGIGAGGIDESSGLLAQHMFLEAPMEEGVGDVELPGCPPLRGGDGEHGPYRH